MQMTPPMMAKTLDVLAHEASVFISDISTFLVTFINVQPSLRCDAKTAERGVKNETLFGNW